MFRKILMLNSSFRSEHTIKSKMADVCLFARTRMIACDVHLKRDMCVRQRTCREKFVYVKSIF